MEKSPTKMLNIPSMQKREHNEQNKQYKYTPQNNWRTNAISYNIDAFCVERILKTNYTI